ncbi:hypothetical protein Trydic_g11244 [Trypoxylus dichotomus]
MRTVERLIKGFSTTGIYTVRWDISSDEDIPAGQQKEKVPHLVIANSEVRQPPIVLSKDIGHISPLKKKTGTRGRKFGCQTTSTLNKDEIQEFVNSSSDKVAGRITDEAALSCVSV